MKKILDAEINIAAIRVFQKENDDGSTYTANIIDGMISGVGLVSAFVPVQNIQGEITENAMYPCELFLKSTRGKLGIDIKILGQNVAYHTPQ